MHTTITVNGADGLRFLETLSDHVPAALASLRASDDPSIEVAQEDAELVAAFLDEALPASWVGAPPLLFSPALGDEVWIVRDALLELQVPRRTPRTWRLIERGTRGRLVALHDGIARVVIGDGPCAQHVAFVGDYAMTLTKARRRPRQAVR